MKTSHKQFPVRTLTFAVQGALVAMFALPLAAMATTPMDSPLTATGMVELLVVPLPSWPLELSPQHSTAPALFRAQV